MNGKSLLLDFITWINHDKRAKKSRLAQVTMLPKISIFLVLLCLHGKASEAKQGSTTSDITSRQQEILQMANNLMETLPISYVYGGSNVTSARECNLCTNCLLRKSPDSKNRLKKCPSCKNCSLDCSHFTQVVYKLAGLHTPYINTSLMLSIKPSLLLRKYNLATIPNLSSSEPGDLLVYQGHVVILERRHPHFRGDIIHATGGKDIKLPGQGIQRERNVSLVSFRGPLERILRHSSLLPR